MPRPSGTTPSACCLPGGGVAELTYRQIVGMMIVYPLLRAKKIANEKIFRLAVGLALIGYVILLGLIFVGFAGSLYVLLVPGILVFLANGILSVLTTVFLYTEDTGVIAQQSAETIVGLRLLMTVLPILTLVAVFFFFGKKFKLTDAKMAEIGEELKERRGEA